MLRRLRSRLSYANVVASVALFVSLGGGAYAALTLPRDSVGRAQLRDGAVGVRELGVALGASSLVDERGQEIQRGGCGPGPDGGPAPPCVPPPPVTLAADSLKSRARGILLVSALVGMAETPGTTGDANVSLTVLVDGRELPRQSHVDVPPGTNVEAPYQSSVRVRKGRHRIKLLINASNYDGTLVVGPITLNSVVLPVAK